MAAGPSSVRFDPSVLSRLHTYVAAHPGASVSAASNRLVDEGLRSQEHPQVLFRDGPAGRRARLVGGPDVWQVIRAVRSSRGAEPTLQPAEVIALVADSAGVGAHLVQAAISYWAAYPSEIDELIIRADAEDSAARTRWSASTGCSRRERER